MSGGHGFSHLMFLRAVVAHRWPARERCGVLAVATALASHAQVRSGEKCYPSTKTLLKEAGVSRPTLFKAKRRLREAGFLEWRAAQLQGNAYRHHYTLRIPDEPAGQTQIPAAGQSEAPAWSISDTGRRSNGDTVTKTIEQRQGTGGARDRLSGPEDQTGLTPPDIDPTVPAYDWANAVAMGAAQSGRFVDGHSSIRKQILGALGEGRSQAAITEALKAHVASGAVRKSWGVLDEVVRGSPPEHEIYDPYEEVEYQTATTDRPARGGSDR